MQFSYLLIPRTYRWNFLQVNYKGKTISLPFNFDILDWAVETRQLIANAKLPDGVCFYNIYGTSLDTPFDVWYVTKLLFRKKKVHL